MDRSLDIEFQSINRRRLLFDDLERNATNFPDRVAIHDLTNGRRTTFRQLVERVRKAANVLSGTLGISQGDRIAVLGRNHHDTIVLYYASSLIGSVIVPLNFRGNTDELAYILGDCTPAVLAVSDEFSERIDARLFDGRRRLVFGAADGGDEFARLIDVADPAVRRRDVGEYDPAFIMYTGGTTGKPKGVVQGQAAYVALAQNMLLALAPQAIARSDSWLMCAPLYHGGGWAYTVTTLHWGMCLHLLPEFDAARILAALRAGFGTVTWLVPTMSRILVDHEAREGSGGAGLGCLRLIVSAGARLDAALRQEMAQTFSGATILDMVGQTEVTSTTLALSEADVIAGWPDSVGLPVPGMAVAILDEHNRPVAPGEVGEICYRGNQLMLGYWNKPEATEEAMAGGWFHSGDLGRRDGNGIVSMVGRKKDIIKSGGETIVPAEIEDVIREVDDVLDVCVIGIADPLWGERVHAVIASTVSPDERQDLLDRIRTHCRKRISGYKIPKTWNILDNLPLSAVGKVDKTSLARLASESA